MSRHSIVLVAAAIFTACDHESGPSQTRDDVFVYALGADSTQTVHVRTMRGNITVEPSPDDTLRVRASISWRGRRDPMRGLALSGRVEGSDILICAVWGSGTCTVARYHSDIKFSDRARGVSNAAVHFQVAVPHGVRLDLVGVDGSITSASSAPVNARSVNGNVTVVTARGPVRAETLNGSVDARMASLTGSDSVVVKSLNGDAWAFLPEGVAATVDVSVTNGSVDTDFPGLQLSPTSRRTLRATLGGGGTPVRVRTLNGTAGVRRLDAEGRSYPR
ncbi:MAG: hypothetical protein WD771_05930 [Gemmatimonadaceae bacterium]